MSTPQPPSDDERTDRSPAPAEAELATTNTGDASAASASAVQASAEKARTPAARTPRVTGGAGARRKRAPKPSAPSPVGEAPDIMDATLGTSNPVARTEAEPSSPAEPTLPSAAEAEGLASAKSAQGGQARAKKARGVAAGDQEMAADAPTAPTVQAESAVQAEPMVQTSQRESAAQAETTTPTVQVESAVQAERTVQVAQNESTAPTDSEHQNATGAAQTDSAQPDATSADLRSRRSVVDLADRLDDSRFFSALFDFTFTSYVTRRLAGPVYVVGLVLIALGILVGFAQSLAIALSTHSPAGAFAFLLGVLVTLVAAILAVLLLRVSIEVFVAIIEIAQNTRGRRRPPRE